MSSWFVTTGLLSPGERTIASADTPASVVLPLCSMKPVSVETAQNQTLFNSADALHEKHFEPVKLNVAVRTTLIETEPLSSSSGTAAVSFNTDSRSPEVVRQDGLSACVLTVPKLTLSTLVDNAVPAQSVLNTTFNPSASSSDISVSDRVGGGSDVTFYVASESKQTVGELDMACDSDNDEISSNISNSSSFLSLTFISPSMEEKQGHFRGRRIPGRRLTRMSFSMIM